MDNYFNDVKLPIQWIQNMLQLGMFLPLDQRKLYQLTKECSKQLGLPFLGGSLALDAEKVTQIDLLLGTLACAGLNYSLRDKSVNQQNI